jgi:bifunctional DNase/RNase
MLIPVEVDSFGIHSQNNSPLVVLKESAGSRRVAIPVFPHEAGLIAIKSISSMPGLCSSPLLASAIIQELGGRLVRVVIGKRNDQSFFGKMFIELRDTIKCVECSPGDGIVCTVSSGAPLFADETLFFDPAKENGRTQQENLKYRISHTDTVEFGRYFPE